MKRIHHTDRPIILSNNFFHNQKKDMKPKGLWYDIDSSWLEWCKGNTDWTYKNHFELEIDESKILLIDTKQKLIDFDREYSVKIHETINLNYIDWESVEKKYSGIEISPYRYDCRFSLFWYYGFDVASGCIWDFDCLKSTNKIII